MALFHYSGTDEAGASVSGTVEAHSRANATHQLRERGIWIRKLEEAKGAPRGGGAPEHGGVRFSPLYGLCPISAGTMGNFYEQMANLFRAGVGMQSLVQDTAARVGSGRLRAVLLQVAPAVAAGGLLSQQLARYPQVFPRAAVGMLRAGEVTGNLDELAKDLAEEYMNQQRGWWYVAAAKVYFSIVALLVVLVPSFPMIIGHGTVVQGIALWVRYVAAQVLPWIALVVGIWLVLRAVWGLPHLAALRDRLDFGLPFRGNLTRKSGLARFYKVLQLCVRAGVDFPVALETAAEAAGNGVMVGRLMQAAARVRGGVPLYEALVTCGLMSREALGLLSSAEAAGSFDETLPRMVDQARTSRDGTAKSLRVGGLVSVYALASVAVLIAAVIGYRNLYSAMAQAAGFTLEELLQ